MTRPALPALPALPELQELVALRGAAHACTLRRRAAPSARVGDHRGAPRGRGLEFEEVRAYVPGDDPRSIHWRVTARRGRAHTKLFREERERPVWLLVDLRAGMFFGSRVQTKSALAVRAAALLAWTAVLEGDRVGGVIVGPGALRCLPPRARERGAVPLLSALVSCQPRAPAAAEDGSLDAGLRRLVPLVRPGSLVLALSDFAGLAESDAVEPGQSPARASPWLTVAAHSECRLFQVSDQLERSGLPAGWFRGGWPGRLRTLDGSALRAGWLRAWQEREACLATLATRLRAPLRRLDTGADVVQSLVPGLRTAATVA